MPKPVLVLKGLLETRRAQWHFLPDGLSKSFTSPFSSAPLRHPFCVPHRAACDTFASSALWRTISYADLFCCLCVPGVPTQVHQAELMLLARKMPAHLQHNAMAFSEVEQGLLKATP